MERVGISELPEMLNRVHELRVSLRNATIPDVIKRVHKIELSEMREIRKESRREYDQTKYHARGKSDRHAFTYVFYRDWIPLYVGKTYNLWQRFYSGPSSHQQDKEWFESVTKVVVSVYSDDTEAYEAEAWMIRQLNPIHNKQKGRTRLDEPPTPIARYEGDL